MSAYRDPAIERMREAVARLETEFGKSKKFAELRALIDELAEAERAEFAEREAEGTA